MLRRARVVGDVKSLVAVGAVGPKMVARQKGQVLLGSTLRCRISHEYARKEGVHGLQSSSYFRKPLCR